MEEYLRDSPIGTASKINYRDNRNGYEQDLGVQNYDCNPNASVDPACDFNAQEIGRDAAPAANDPYYETFEFLGSPNNSNVSPAGIIDSTRGLDFSRSENASVEPFNFGVPPRDQLDTLDLIISPPTGNDKDDQFFTSSQYFLPNSRSNNFSLLNPISENTVDRSSYQRNGFSPEIQGGISIPASRNMRLYLSSNAFVSPQFNTYEGSYDTIASPYLNSPPPINLTQSTSIPNPTNFTQDSLSRALSPAPVAQQGLGVSAPTRASVPLKNKTAEATPAGQNLTQEEKAKRRREFHNAVERRRRDLIKEKIKILGVLVPPSLLTPQLCATQAILKLSQPLSAELKEMIEATKVKEVKPNKAAILLTSADYIRHLHYVIERQRARREEIENLIASFENVPGSYSYTGVDFATPSVSIHSQTADFNPDEFFSDVITETIQDRMGQALLD